MKQLLFLVLIIFYTGNLSAQIGIGINPPDASAMLHVQDTAKGMLV